MVKPADDKPRSSNWRIRPSVRRALRVAAATDSITMEAYVEQLLVQELTSRGFIRGSCRPRDPKSAKTTHSGKSA